MIGRRPSFSRSRDMACLRKGERYGDLISVGSSSRWGCALEFVNLEEEMDIEDTKLEGPFAQKWKWELHKFGGSSMSDIKNVAHVLTQHCSDEQIAVVVSAMGGVTDQLFKIMDLCRARDHLYITLFDRLIERHITTMYDLLPNNEQLTNKFITQIMKDSKDIKEILRGIFACRSLSAAFVELVSGYGELWSSLLLTTYLQAKKTGVVRIDARDVLVIKTSVEGFKLPASKKKHQTRPVVQVDWEISSKKVTEWKQKHSDARWLIITGYICSNADGIATTLKRNGSDFSAAIFGALLKVRTVTIWTDVTGVYSADPRKIKGAVKLKEMTYQEASELAYFGGHVIHPNTMMPCMIHNIPLKIRSSFHPEDPGTKICRNLSFTPNQVIKCFSTLDDLSILTIEGRGELSRFMQLVFTAFQKQRISIILVAQSSFGHSYHLCVPNFDGTRAKEIIENALLREIKLGEVTNIILQQQCAILAGIGEGIISQPSVTANFFNALGNAKVKVLVMSQGSGDRSIAVVISQKIVHDAVQAVHNQFYPSISGMHKEETGSNAVSEALSTKSLKSFEDQVKSKDIKIEALEARLKKVESVNNHINRFDILDDLDIDSLDIVQLRKLLHSMRMKSKKSIRKKDADILLTPSSIHPKKKLKKNASLKAHPQLEDAINNLDNMENKDTRNVLKGKEQTKQKHEDGKKKEKQQRQQQQ